MSSSVGFQAHDPVSVILLTMSMHLIYTVYPKKNAHGFCFAGLCCSYTLTDFPISIRLTSLALWQSNDCPSASKATLMNMDKCFMWIHYGRLHNHNKAKHSKTVCIFRGIYCTDTHFHRIWSERPGAMDVNTFNEICITFYLVRTRKHFTLQCVVCYFSVLYE